MKKVIVAILGLTFALTGNTKEVAFQCSHMAINKVDIKRNLAEDNPGGPGLNEVVISDEMVVVKKGDLFNKDAYFPRSEFADDGVVGTSKSMLLIQSSDTSFVIYLARKPFSETADDLMTNIRGAVSLDNCAEIK